MILVGIVLLGLALRVAAATGGLWLDEAWSAVFAADVAAPLGVFLNVNHDNNHHLNTLWLQCVGIDARPLFQRGLAIASGAAAIVVAARIGARRGIVIGLATASLFAVSPILVTYGSEARGYAPMVLAMLVAIGIVDRWLADPVRPAPAIALAITAGLGLLFHLSMLFGLVALTGWVLCHASPGAERRRAVRLLAPMAIVAAAIPAAILFPAGRHFQFGAMDPYSNAALAEGVRQAIGWAIGWWDMPLWMLPVVGGVAMVMAAPRLRMLGVLLLLGLPLGVAALRLGNTGFARYHLLTAMAALLLLAGLARNRGGQFVLAAIVMASLTLDARMIANHRADPAAAIRTMWHLAPGGATVLLERTRSTAILRVAAAQAGYPLTPVEVCPARFLFVERNHNSLFALDPHACGAHWSRRAGATVFGLSGSDWRLYERD